MGLVWCEQPPYPTCNPSKDGVLALQLRRGVQGDEELRPVGVRLVLVGASQQATVGEPQPAVHLVLEGAAVDGVTTLARASRITSCE